MLLMLQDKRIKQKFKSEFGVSVDDFMDASQNININDLKKGVVKNENEEIKVEIQPENDDVVGEDQNE